MQPKVESGTTLVHSPARISDYLEKIWKWTAENFFVRFWFQLMLWIKDILVDNPQAQPTKIFSSKRRTSNSKC